MYNSFIALSIYFVYQCKLILSLFLFYAGLRFQPSFKKKLLAHIYCHCQQFQYLPWSYGMYFLIGLLAFSGGLSFSLIQIQFVSKCIGYVMMNCFIVDRYKFHLINRAVNNCSIVVLFQGMTLRREAITSLVYVIIVAVCSSRVLLVCLTNKFSNERSTRHFLNRRKQQLS